MVRDRIVGLRRVPASELRPSPANWRTHPDAQRSALAGVLDTVGLVDAVIARETPDGLELVDGHLRADVLAAETVPVLVVDLDDAEAAHVLATLDPLSAMAEMDGAALSDLLDSLGDGLDVGAVWGDDAVAALTAVVPDALEPLADGEEWPARPPGKMGVVDRGSPSYVGIAGDITRLDDPDMVEWLRPDPVGRIAAGMEAWQAQQPAETDP